MQGFNMGRYRPPDAPTANPNSIHKKRAPGTLKKDGTQTVRFELPFAVWCHTCQPHAIIGQGVRFNAEKKKVGNYYSTPIWSFRLKHAACGGTIEVRTDPKNTAYVVVAGGKARDYGDPEDKVREGEGGTVILTAEERERRRGDAFAALEGRREEEAQGKETKRRVEEMYQAGDRDGRDPWAANRRVRGEFRKERKRLKREEDERDQLKERLGTEMEILDATEEDSRRAGLVSFGDGDDQSAGDLAIFKSPGTPARAKSKSSRPKENRAEVLRKRLLSNTRASMNPFGAS